MPILACGSNSHGGLALGDRFDVNKFQSIIVHPSLENVCIAVGGRHSIIYSALIDEAGRLLSTESSILPVSCIAAAGDNEQGQLGESPDTLKVSTTFRSLDWSLPIRMVSCGWENTAIVTTSGQLWITGISSESVAASSLFAASSSSLSSSPSSSSSSSSSTFHPMHPCTRSGWRNEAVIAIACGRTHALAMTDDGSIYSWGTSRRGALGSSFAVVGEGIASETKKGIVERIKGLPPSSLILKGSINSTNSTCGAIAAGDSDKTAPSLDAFCKRCAVEQESAAAVESGGVVSEKKSCGKGGEGAVFDSSCCPRRLNLSVDVVETESRRHEGDSSAASNSSASSTSIRCSTIPSSAFLGASRRSSRVTPQLACGLDHSVALLPNGILVTWGDNRFGQCGRDEDDEGGGTRATSMTASGSTSTLLTAPSASLIVEKTTTVKGSAPLTSSVPLKQRQPGIVRIGESLGTPSELAAFDNVQLCGKRGQVKKIASGWHHTLCLIEIDDDSDDDDCAEASPPVTNGTVFEAAPSLAQKKTPKTVVFGWGRMSEGQLGRSLCNEASSPSPSATASASLPSRKCGTPRLLHFNEHASEVLKKDGDSPRFLDPKQRFKTIHITDIACGSLHSLFVGDCGCLWTCGWNEHGSLGLGDKESAPACTNDIESVRGFGCSRFAWGQLQTANARNTEGDVGTAAAAAKEATSLGPTHNFAVAVAAAGAASFVRAKNR